MTAEADRVTAYVHDSTHVAEGLSLMPFELRKPKLLALQATWLRQVQLLEDAAWQVLTQTGIAVASDAAQDQNGELVGLGRWGMEDEVYRRAQRAMVLAHRSAGSADDVIGVAQAMRAAEDIALDEVPPAAMVLSPATAWDQPAEVVGAIARTARSGGVDLQVVLPPTDKAFAFSSSSSPEYDPAHGFGDAAQTTGGRLAGVVH